MHTEKYVLLSYTLSKNTPVYKGTPAVEIKSVNEIRKGDSCNTAILRFSNHTGTHVDAPYHFDGTGRKISDYTIDELIFHKPLVVDCPMKPDGLVDIDDINRHEADLKQCDILLVKTGFSLKRKNEEYYLHNPGISSKAADWLRSRFANIRAVGIDSLSISSVNSEEEGIKAHHSFLDKKADSNNPILLIEDLDLSENLEQLKRIYVIPLLVDGLDGVPCTVFAEVG